MCAGTNLSLSIVLPRFPLPQHFRASWFKCSSPQNAPRRKGSATIISDNNSGQAKKIQMTFLALKGLLLRFSFTSNLHQTFVNV